MRVILKATGQHGDLGNPAEFDPSIYDLESSPTTPTNPTSQIQQSNQTPLPPINPNSGSNDLFSNIGKTLVKPFVNPLADIYDIGNYGMNALFRGGGEKAFENGYNNPLRDENKLVKTRNQADLGGAALDTAKNVAGIMSYGIPGGASVKGALGLGAARGALQGFSAGEGIDPMNIAVGAAGGAVGGGLGNIVGKGAGAIGGDVLSKATSKISPDIMGKVAPFIAPSLLLGGGGLAGLIKTKNWQGAATGVLAAAGLYAAAKNPAVVSNLAKVIETVGAQAGATSALATKETIAPGLPTITNKSLSGITPVTKTSTELPPVGGNKTKSGEDIPQNKYGFTIPELESLVKHYQQMKDYKGADEFNTMLKAENAYQAKTADKNKTNTHAATGFNRLEDVKNNLGISQNINAPINKLEMFNSDLPGSSPYKSNIDELMKQYTQSQLTRFTPDVVKGYVQNLTPHWWESDDVIKNKLRLIEDALNQAKYLTPIDTQGAAVDAVYP